MVERILKNRLIWIKVYFEVLAIIYFIGLIYILKDVSLNIKNKNDKIEK